MSESSIPTDQGWQTMMNLTGYVNYLAHKRRELFAFRWRRRSRAAVWKLYQAALKNGFVSQNARYAALVVGVLDATDVDVARGAPARLPRRVRRGGELFFGDAYGSSHPGCLLK
ncbi:MAG: hypothetical protein MUQ30_19310 [Anaerolineae bacterium]|nr:hypothetical protein [Anaerolineae bacterium]